ncbi:hypothetical protein FisN_8Hh004 [Fistulifera solaris]|uniref:CBM6 domain-containing protein n=1 Tax=Fistulifera solaris TaxID=1519565 RepID=A0A1Z5JJG7_FISSO|nr:hypothetical protein FisN_8Hh004 [Fistulifera solaris]|eukprot:GAX14157.1 hypothetical protein FisN_8Hh004 [Fistulifera solaris]
MSFLRFCSVALLILLKSSVLKALEVIEVPAANMTKSDGTSVVFTTERFESYAFIRTGDEIRFSITTNTSGIFTLHASISNPSDLGAFAITNSETSQIYGSAVSLPVSQSWDEWNTITVDNIRLTEGTHPLELTVIEGGWKIQYLYLVQMEEVTVIGPHHYMIPGVDLMDFFGIEYYPYEKIVAKIERGDWFAYNLPIKTAGNYTLHFWVASPEGGGSFRVLNGATKKPYASIRTLPMTGDWLDWAIVDVPDIQLNAGNVPINISVTSDGWNFCMLSYELYDPAHDPLNTETNCGKNLTTTDLAVGDSMTFAAETICDNEGISFETSSEGGLNIGWLDEGNWVAYDVNLANAGIYDVGVRYSSVDGDGGFMLSNLLTGTVYHVQQELETTGDWQAWSTLQNATVSLPSGVTVIQLKSLGGGWNLQSIQLTRRGAGTPVSPPVAPPVLRPVESPVQAPLTLGQVPVPGLSPVGIAPVQSPLVPVPGMPVLAPVPVQIPVRPIGQVMPIPSPVQAPFPARPLSPLPILTTQTEGAPVQSPVPLLPVQASIPIPAQSKPTNLSPLPLQPVSVPARAPFMSPTLL